MEYPTSYASLVRALLGKKADKGETRTDWRRRPLTDGQIRYALEDVRHLLPLRDKLGDMLHQMGRVDWLAAEIAACQDAVQVAKSRRRWRNVSGISGLSSRCLAIVRELWVWRDQQARARDVPPRRVLRDDLMVEIARRKSTEPNRIRAVRGLNRRALDRAVPELAECVRRGLELPADQLPHKPHRQVPPQLGLLGQFLAAALNSVCKDARVATSIVGTVSDVRALVAHRLGLTSADGQEVPELAKGWRTEVVGTMLDDLLAGRTCVRIQDPMGEAGKVLQFVPYEATKTLEK